MIGTNRRNRELTVGVLGSGYISKYHLEGLRAVPNVRVVAVCDLNRKRAQLVAGTFGVPGVYDNLDAMLAEAKPDAVHVLLPPAAHADATVRILESGAHVFTEKPICLGDEELSRIRTAAERTGRLVGTGHNFLFSEAYERLARDVQAGLLGRLERLDVMWGIELPQLRVGPFDGWLFKTPTNILFEVGPHPFAYVLHLAGTLRDPFVRADDWITLPGGRSFARRWDVLGTAGSTSVRLRLHFGAGYPEHTVAVRGTSGVGVVDQNANTYSRTAHTAQMLDIDRFLTSTRAAGEVVGHAASTLGHFVFAKAGLEKVGTPYGRSIAACMRAFYRAIDGERVDDRIGVGVAGGVVELATAVSRAVTIPAPRIEPEAPISAPATTAPSVLVLGGTGFIGRALVQRLREAGHGVRLLARSPGNVPGALRALGVEIVRGDFTDTASVSSALEGIKHVYHLARGDGETWEEYSATDVEPTRLLAELCAGAGVESFHYTSSISIYYSGKRGGTITEDTPPHPGIARSNLYSRSKVENERNLMHLHRTRGFPIVIYRPGIVVGRGGNPMHPGVCGWPYPSVTRLRGDGRNPLPIVLVGDCADAMVRALGRADVGGRSFNLVGEPCVTAQEYLDTIERVTGMKLRRVSTSSYRYYAEEIAKYAIKSLGRDPHRRRPSYEEWDGQTFRASFDISLTKRMLGWTPAASKDVVMREGIEIPAREYFS